MERKAKMTQALIHAILILVSITMLVPFVWMILTAFKSMGEATSVDPFVIFPSVWRTESFTTVINNMDFFQLYLNTLLLIAGRVIAAVLTATLAGYAFGTFLLRQAYMGLPRDLEAAARLDGCNIGQTFLFIGAPLTRSSMVALGIFTAVFAYKDLMWLLICNRDVMPLSAALAKMQGQYSSNYPQLMAASLLACIPMIVLYLIFQKQFIEGIATSGGKL